MVTIEVEVTGGTLPVPIQREIDKKNIPNYEHREDSGSFFETVTLSNGVRTVRFKIKNSNTSKTRITISGVDSKGIKFTSTKIIEGRDIKTAIFKLII